MKTDFKILITVPALVSASCGAPEEKTTDKVENTNTNIIGNPVNVRSTRKFLLNEMSIKEEMVQRRAIEAVVWGMPIVNFQAMRDGLKKDAGVGF